MQTYADSRIDGNDKRMLRLMDMAYEYPQLLILCHSGRVEKMLEWNAL